jgi:hypothetical protein
VTLIPFLFGSPLVLSEAGACLGSLSLYQFIATIVRTFPPTDIAVAVALLYLLWASLGEMDRFVTETIGHIVSTPLV